MLRCPRRYSLHEEALTAAGGVKLGAMIGSPASVRTPSGGAYMADRSVMNMGQSTVPGVAIAHAIAPPIRLPTTPQARTPSGAARTELCVAAQPWVSKARWVCAALSTSFAWGAYLLVARTRHPQSRHLS